MDATLDKLERLAALHRSGALSDAEYEAQKARVLADETVANERAAQGPLSAPPPVSDAQLSRAWQRRFAFFRTYGSPFGTAGATALLKLPFWPASSIRFNIWAFVLGPIYYFVLGLWKRGLSMFGLAAVISIVCQHLLGDTALQIVGIVEATLFAISVNYPYFIKVTEGRDEWNPLVDLFDRPTGGPVRPADQGPL